jgi:hypothetical protein
MTDAMQSWADRNRVKQAPGRICIHRLNGKRRHDNHKCYPPAGDHCSLWLDKNTGRPKFFISQPYQIYDYNLEETIKFCHENNLEFVITSYPSWHNPGNVIFIEYSRKDNG